MKFLIPPSEGKSIENSTKILFKTTDYKYTKQVNQVLNNLKSVESSDFKKIYGVEGDKAKLIHEINLKIKNRFCSPAINRYTGVVFSNIGFDSLTNIQKHFFNNHFFIFSGFLGMVRPLELIPNYKLKMNVLKLYKFWNPILTKDLSQEDSIIDLLPQIHKKAYTPNKNCRNIEFIILKNGKKVHAGHFGKAIKGKFIRFICQNQLTHFKELIHFKEDGFKWDGKVFLKES